MFKFATWIVYFFASLFCLTYLALYHGESINSIWLVIVSILVLFIGYRYYSSFIAKKVLRLDPKATTPAVRLEDGIDYVPTNRYVLFGHHFAAIAGAGPLIGPILALQMGYFPGIIWILTGVVIAGAVQDFIILVISMRHDGRSLGDLIKQELGIIPGVIATISMLSIMVILLSVLALIVVKALAHSPWSLFTVIATIPIAVFMGVYLRFIRPMKVAEISVIGFLLLILALLSGKLVAQSETFSALFNFDANGIMWMLMGYGFVASVLPVWILLAPRDYLSTFMKIGTIVSLAIAILIVAPMIKMPALTSFINGNGPVWPGSLFPFLFITIACGAVSGFHALIASGTTPKMIQSETDTRLVGYGGMLMEAFVAIMALIAAACLEPGLYFAINSPAAVIGNTPIEASNVISSWGFSLTPEIVTDTASSIGEISILSRTGGAPTLAIGIANIFSQLFTNQAMLSFWYHFAILFEAIFILTAIDAGTRVGRFMIQDFMGTFYLPLRNTKSWINNIIATTLCVSAWGYFLYQGVTDPFGGINSLWPLFGIANQMLAAIAFILGTVYFYKTNRKQYAFVTLIPMAWLLICTLSAAWQKILSSDPAIGFIAHANRYKEAFNNNLILHPATSLNEMGRIVFNDYINLTLVSFFASVVVFLFLWGMVKSYKNLHQFNGAFEFYQKPKDEMLN